jgi:hypothetical protein
VREKTLLPDWLGLEKPGMFGAGLKKLPGNVTVLFALAKKNRDASLPFCETK